MTSAAAAQSLPVTDDAVFTFNGQEITISRSSVLPDTSFDVVSRALSDCLQPCLSPMTAARNVATVGELDVIEFMSGPLENGDGLLVDARLPEDRSAGYIPASVNIPSATVAETNPFRDEILMALGAEQYQGIFNFEGAMDLVVYDDGPATQDAPVFIQDMLAAGYPANKIHYYRGGMQVWTTLGLTTTRAAQ
ncbi:rhodanese-like domain-containing protein [Pseudooctadecabacter jejudonensis]|uniref:rhodanese-like domain-containing protein n=1 Tax=Pseudooctadecabacter jejudonensis TaxID=1391910 RepID=UPI00135632E2|nr:rhodanese-like domain-containing protein [Pseudooctadecabacter jejudonensis]